MLNASKLKQGYKSKSPEPYTSVKSNTRIVNISLDKIKNDLEGNEAPTSHFSNHQYGKINFRNNSKQNMIATQIRRLAILPLTNSKKSCAFGKKETKSATS